MTATQAESVSLPDPGPTAECLVRRLDQLRRFLRRHHFSERVIERAIDRVIRSAIRYLGEDPPPPLRDRVSWLFGSALKAARQVAAREPDCDDVDPSFLAACTAESSSEAMNEALDAALDQLTAPQKQALDLCVVRGLTLAEAAEEMGCLPSTVQRHRVRGIERLRRILIPTQR